MLIYVACVAISMKSSVVDNKMAATSLRFRRACEEDLDKRLSDLKIYTKHSFRYDYHPRYRNLELLI